MRESLRDFFFNSWRLVAANLAWGLVFVVVIVAGLVVPLLGWLLAPLLALPTAGLFRLAALIARDEPASFWDAWAAWRSAARPALAAGVGASVMATVLAVNLLGGLLSGSTLGWALATLAAWGLLVVWLILLCFWPLLLDPRREPPGPRAALRLAGLLVLAHPGRLAILGLLAAVVLAASTVAFAALVTVAVAFVALVACRYVLPAADRLEVRLTAR
ncbi:MAG TPA: hypothetical protein VFW92_08095 [Candidatus Limnocylindrales bacterium]|nr:hypothetical protein [Candidatus Limnocylindrales bacterium]